jgi:hypothetical protein
VPARAIHSGDNRAWQHSSGLHRKKLLFVPIQSRGSAPRDLPSVNPLNEGAVLLLCLAASGFCGGFSHEGLDGGATIATELVARRSGEPYRLPDIAHYVVIVAGTFSLECRDGSGITDHGLRAYRN